MGPNLKGSRHETDKSRRRPERNWSRPERGVSGSEPDRTWPDPKGADLKWANPKGTRLMERGAWIGIYPTALQGCDLLSYEKEAR